MLKKLINISYGMADTFASPESGSNAYILKLYDFANSSY
jgi:hypothetical protein